MRRFYLTSVFILITYLSAFSQGETCSTAIDINIGTHQSDGPLSGNGFISGCNFTGSSNADWYKYTPSCDGYITISSDHISNGNGFDSRLSLFSGNCSNLICEASDDNGGIIGYSLMSTISNFQVIAGNTYHIQWDDKLPISQIPFKWTLTFKALNGINNLQNNIGIANCIVHWMPTGQESSWTIEFGDSDFILGTGNTILIDSANGSWYNFTGLNSDSTYSYYISVDSSDCFEGPYTFTTLSMCPPPINSSLIVNSSNDVLFNWQASPDMPVFGVSWEIIIAPSPVSFLTDTIIEVIDSYYLHQNLLPCTTYEYYVRTKRYVFLPPTCYSDFIGPLYFKTECFASNNEVEEQFLIFPNPIKDQMIIQKFNSEEQTRITIYNLQGNEIYNNTFINNKHIINSSNFESGIYIVKINCDNYSETFKIVKE